MPTYVTASPETVQTPVELDVIEIVPSPFVPTVAVKLPPNTPLDGRFEIAIDVGVARPTAKV
ncbi:MAG: hypothetical protein JO186_11445 [Actinobacteria bacterium]|nr:hypothetical protein [Actinomycetota bacterium]